MKRNIPAGLAGPTIIAVALVLVACAPEKPTDAVSNDPPPATSDRDHGALEIPWHDGDVDSAFAAARRSSKPVYLYWGADWCPPCNQIKATIFARPAFVERAQSFVPVNLDGDEPGAQKLGEQFGVLGYPTVIVFTPGGDEITRIPGGLDIELYASVMDIALAATRPAAAAYQAALDGTASDADFRLLAYYAWDQDNERLAGDGDLATALWPLAENCPPGLRAERSRLLMQSLLAMGMRNDDSTTVEPLAGERRTAALDEVMAILSDPGLTKTNAATVLYGVEPLMAALDVTVEIDKGALTEAWRLALERLFADPATSVADRVGALFGHIGLERAVDPDAPIPQALTRRIVDTIDDLDASITDTYERMAFVNAAWNTLREAGLEDAAWELTNRELKTTQFPEYVMLELAALARRAGRSEEAVEWLSQAWNSARGPATRFQWGTNYVIGLIELAPDESAAIEDTTIALFRELQTETDAFHLRTTARMDRLEARFDEWNADGGRQPTIDRIRAEVVSICAALLENESRDNCRSFLAT